LNLLYQQLRHLNSPIDRFVVPKLDDAAAAD
jgi:hypothetical protein